MDENKFPELAAMLATKNHQNKRAVQVLQGAQRYELHYHVLGTELRPDNSGHWIPIDDVVKAIQILQEGVSR